MRFLITLLLLLSLAGCSKKEAPAVESEVVDDRVVGPTTSDYFVVEATDGRKAELNFYDRTQEGVLLAYGRNGQKYEFAESRLTEESIEKLHAFKAKEAMVSVRLQELTSHTGSSGTSDRKVYAHNHQSGFTGSSGNSSSGSASASHIVQISTTSPYEKKIKVETFYSGTSGGGRTAQQQETYIVRRDQPVEFQIGASSGASLLQPTVIVRDMRGVMLDFETKNIKLQNQLSSMR